MRHWPEAPSDCIDPTWYVYKVDRSVDQAIGSELFFHSWNILHPALESLRDQLETAPVSVFKTIVGPGSFRGDLSPIADPGPKGVTLLDVALAVCEHDKQAAKETKDRWRNVPRN